MQTPAVGIDLGTTNSVVAVSLNGKPQVLVDPASTSPLIPSVVSFGETGERIVGRAARARKAFDPAHTVSSVKRLLGRPFKSEEVRRAKSRVAFELKEGADSAVLVETRGGSFSLPEVSAMVLREVRRVAESALGHKVERCVVTVPANFNELQRSSTKIAGKIAELEVVRILNEPTAAALAYGYGRGTREKICIYDFGGGTFDVTLLELNGNVFEVLSTWGDTFLGGDDIDLAITDWLAPTLAQKTRIDATRDRLAYDILRDAVESAKCALSQRDVAQVDFNYMPPGGGAPVRFQHPFARTDLDRLAGPFVEKTFSVCQEALKLAGMRANELTAVILVGGSTRIHSVRAQVTQFFGREPLTHLPPEEVVALGASILAEALSGGQRRGARHTPIPVVSQPPTPSVVPLPPSPAARPSLGAPPGASVMRAPTTQGIGPEAAATRNGPPAIPGAPGSPPHAPPPFPAGLRPAFAPPAPSQRPSTAPPALPPSAPKAPVPSFDLDDPFNDPPPGSQTVALAPPTPSFKPTPLPRAAAGLDSLDEPSFVGHLPEVVTNPAQVPPLRRTIEQHAPAFNLDDTSMAAPLPSAPGNDAHSHSSPELPSTAPELPAMAPELPVVSQPSAPQRPSLGAPPARTSHVSLGSPPARPSLGAPPVRPSQQVPPVGQADASPGTFSSALASLPPSIAAAIRPPPPKPDAASMFPADPEATSAMPSAGEGSVPSFNLDTEALFAATDAPPPMTAVAERRETSVPSFRIDPDDIFGIGEVGGGTLVAKSPYESSLPDFGNAAATPEHDHGVEETTRTMAAPVLPTAAAASAPLVVPAAPLVVPTTPLEVPGAPLVVPTAPPLMVPAAPVSFAPNALGSTLPFNAAVPPEELPPMVVPPSVKSVVPPKRSSLVPSSPGDTLKPSLPPARATAAPAAPSGASTQTATASMAPARNSTGGIAMPLLLDVTPLSLGVETAGGVCESVISRNATIPVEQTRVFATINDDQTSVIIRIAQGESRRFSENQLLGELELSGLRPAPRGEVSVAVTFELGADGTLSARARDVETGVERATRVSLLTLPSESAQADMAARQRAAVVPVG